MKSRIVQLYLFLFLAYVSTTDTFAVAGNNGSRKLSASFPVQVNTGWNLISLPATTGSPIKGNLYPTALSPAFAYQEAYIARETLEVGLGYWLKFSSAQTIYLEGDTVLESTVHVKTGWNLIGSLSVPIPIGSVLSYPEGIITPKYYGYDAAAGGYQESDTIKPGKGYWVKVAQDGVLFLTVPDNSPSFFSDTLRSVILDSINAFVNRLPHVNDSTENLALLDYLRSIPELEASDTISGGVWARFTDGRMFLRTDNLDIGDTLPFNNGFGIEKMGDTPEVITPADNLPFYSDAWIVNSLGSYYEGTTGGGVTPTVNQLRSWHKTTGYSLVSYAGADVWDLRRVANVGVFYISAHGGFTEDRSNTEVFGLWTATEKNVLFDRIFKDDLDSGYLVYYTATNSDNGSGGEIEETHYAITSKFVQRYMSFDPGALVFINACEGYKKTAFANACISKGAGVYAGWTNTITTVKALRAARHFFDRMLGTNQYFPESPPQRPFDADLAWNDLILKHYDIIQTNKGLARFWLDPVIPSYNLLAPSILQCYPEFIPGGDDFYIDGLFGENPGAGAATVKVGNAVLGIREWMSSTKLRLDPPPHGGNVQVSVRGRKSNVTQYTEWHAVFDYTLTGRGSLKQHIIMNVDFLADVHSFRLNIADPPVYPFPRFIQILNTSHVTYECSGEYKNPKDTALVEEFWTGSGSVPFGNTNPGFALSAMLAAPGNANFAELSFSGTFNNTGNPQPLGLLYNVGSFTITMNSSYVILGGSQPGSGSMGNALLTWQNITPVYPPDPNGAR